MPRESYTISCLILKPGGPYYVGGSWDEDIGKACHYTAIHQAEMALKALMSKHADATIRCVIQNKFFDYYDGQKFVYSLLDARLYSHEEAESELRKVNI